MAMHSKTDVQLLLAQATASGVLSHGTSSIITGNLGNIVIAGAAGLAMENIEASDVTLVTLLIDASSSIHDGGLTQSVRDGHAALLDAFAKSREKDSILVATWLFHSELQVLHSYVPVSQAMRLTDANYNPCGCTTLYDAWCDGLTANVAYAERLRTFGTPCRSIAVVMTDGADYGSKRSAKDCACISRDLLKTEQFTLAFVGVGDQVAFRKVADSMGVPSGNVQVETEARSSNVRRMFHMVSQSALRVSQRTVQPGAGFFSP